MQGCFEVKIQCGLCGKYIISQKAKFHISIATQMSREKVLPYIYCYIGVTSYILLLVHGQIALLVRDTYFHIGISMLIVNLGKKRCRDEAL